MTNLFNFVEIADIIPFIIVPVVFMVVIIAMVVAAVKKTKETKRKSEIAEQQRRQQYTDGNGRTEHQRDYLARMKVQQAERKVKEREHKQRQIQSSMHEHSGKAEHYEPIVGSLGEVDDEGCNELDGVRLVEHDESYCDDPEHFVNTEMDGLQQAIVLGEVLNNPRFVNPYKRK